LQGRHLAVLESLNILIFRLVIGPRSSSFIRRRGGELRMEDLRRGSPYKYPYEPCLSSYSQAAACLPHYHGNIDTNEGIQIQTLTESIKFVEPGTCIDHDAPATVIFDALSTKSHMIMACLENLL
jgi:hypothetical protein